MKKINDEKYTEYKDVHGNVYYTREEVLAMSQQRINVLAMMNGTKSYYPIQHTINNIELPSYCNAPTLWPTKYCGKDIQAEGVDFTLDNSTHRCDLISFSPYVPQYGSNNLSSPIDINGIPVKLPKGAKIRVNNVPTIKNGEIIGINSHPCIDINEQLESEKTKGWGNSEEGSIEKILYDIGKKTTGTLRHQFSIDNGRIIHSYLDFEQKDPLCIEMYELKTGENNKFRAEFKSSTKIPGGFPYNYNIAVIGNKIYIHEIDNMDRENIYNPQSCVRVYNNHLQCMTNIVDAKCCNLQDFLNRSDPRNFHLLSHHDYAKMEKEYIKKNEKENAPAQPMMNNQGTNTGLNKKRGDGKCSIQ